MKRMPELPCPIHEDAICQEGRCPLFPEVAQAAKLAVRAADQLLDDPESQEAIRKWGESRAIIDGLKKDHCTPDYVL